MSDRAPTLLLLLCAGLSHAAEPTPAAEAPPDYVLKGDLPELAKKGWLRIAVEREVDTGSFTTTGPGYLHPACAAEHTGDDGLLDKIKANMPGLAQQDLDALAADL